MTDSKQEDAGKRRLGHILVTVGILFGPLLVGYIRAVDKQQRGESFAVADVFAGMESFLPAAIAALTSGVLIALASMLFVLPGLALLVAGWIVSVAITKSPLGVFAMLF